jgi:TRAP-type mannitol/chloroaromatic compound transport system substrate-binding protein
MTKEFDALEQGAIKWAATSFNFNLGRLGRVGGLFGASPAGPNAQELFSWWKYGGAHKYAAQMMKRAKADVMVIGGPLHLTGAESFGWFKKPFTSLNDFKGIKYRCMGLYGEVAKKLGAAVVNLPGGEIYQSYERGVIDGFEYCTPSMDYSAGFHNLKAVMMEPGMQSTTSYSSLMVRRDTWEKVPDEFKAVIEAATWGGMEDYAWMMMEDAKAMVKFKEAGVKIHFLPKEVQKEIVSMVDKLYGELAAKDELFKATLEDQNKFLENFRSVDYVVQPQYKWKYAFSK